MAAPVKVFLAHHHTSSADKMADRLVRDLMAAGIDVWSDNAGPLPGSFAEKVDVELRQRQWLVFLVTRGATHSRWVQYEVEAALNQYQRGRMLGVIPFIVEPIAKEDMPVAWRTLISFDATHSYETARDGLLYALGQGKQVPILFPRDQQGMGSSTTTSPFRMFISYRREDSADVTGRIYDRLVLKYGRDSIFKDVDNIPIGADFRRIIDDVMNQCHMVLVVIGQRWLTVTTPQGRQRLREPTDFVRLEVETGLRRQIPVVPILVQQASMPSAHDLPDSLSDLAYRHAVPVRSDPDFHRDVDHLLNGIDRVLPT